MRQERTLLDFHQDWIRLVDKGFANFNSLTRDERVWFNVQAIIGDVDNGGLISHYYNSGANRNIETIEDLRYLGCNDIADLLTKVNELFPDGQPSKHMNERNDIISNWEDGQYDDLLEILDRKFYQGEMDLEQRLVDHIVKTGLSR
jgi:hypothetical protein